MRDLQCEGDKRFRRAYAGTREGSPPGIAVKHVGSGRHMVYAPTSPIYGWQAGEVKSATLLLVLTYCSSPTLANVHTTRGRFCTMPNAGPSKSSFECQKPLYHPAAQTAIRALAHHRGRMRPAAVSVGESRARHPRRGTSLRACCVRRHSPAALPALPRVARTRSLRA